MSPVVIKHFDTSKYPNAKQLLLDEAAKLKSLNHPNIMRVLDFGVSEEGIFWVTDWIDGVTLNEVVPRDKGLPPSEALKLFKQITDAIQAIHDLGILHLDLKPSNILVTRDKQIKLIDFGTRYTPGRGSAGYVAPEVAMKSCEPDKRADIYALGALLAFLLTGRSPFIGDTNTEIVAEQLTNSVSVLHESYLGESPELQHIVEKATRVNPNERFDQADLGIRFR